MDELLPARLATCAGCGTAAGSGWPPHGSPRSSGVAVVFRVPEKYEASARVYVDTQSLLRPVMAGLAIQPNLDQQVALMSRTLITRPNVERLVQLTGLDAASGPAREREALIDKMMKSLQLDRRLASQSRT